MEKVTSYSRMTSQMSSHSVYIGFCSSWWIIHLASSDPPAADDADQPLLDERQMFLQHAGVDREVVDALRGLVAQRMRGSRPRRGLRSSGR